MRPPTGGGLVKGVAPGDGSLCGPKGEAGRSDASRGRMCRRMDTAPVASVMRYEPGGLRRDTGVAAVAGSMPASTAGSHEHSYWIQVHLQGHPMLVLEPG